MFKGSKKVLKTGITFHIGKGPAIHLEQNKLTTETSFLFAWFIHVYRPGTMADRACISPWDNGGQGSHLGSDF